MKHGIRCTATYNIDHQISVADVAPNVLNEDSAMLDASKWLGWVGGSSAQPE